MAFNRFSWYLFLRIVLILITGLAFVLLLQLPGKVFSSAGVLFLIFLQIFGLIRYVNKTNAKLARFVIQLKNQETTGKFSNQKLDKTFKGLTTSFDSIIKEISLNRRDVESKLNFFESIIQNVASGVLALNEKKQVVLFNTAAVELLNMVPPITYLNLKEMYPDLLDEINQMKPGDRKLLLTEVNHTITHFSISLNEYLLPSGHIRLFSFLNIKAELDDKELDSWQKLIRVLAHEIMNSITPVTTLTGAIINTIPAAKYKAEPLHTLTSAQIDDIYESARLIELRMNDIFSFVKNYRSLTTIPTPKPVIFDVSNFLRKLKDSYINRVTESHIELVINIGTPGITIFADESMLHRVMDNLMVNAMHALRHVSNARIKLNAYAKKNRAYIEIIDNGCGIPAEIKDKIFIPFFTTKDKGTGIGLGLAKQIMRLHNGEITVQSEPGKGTAFTLMFLV